jgi:iron complex transport system substrate-binding protein
LEQPVKIRLTILGLCIAVLSVFSPGVNAPLLWGADTPSLETLKKEMNIRGPIRRIIAQNSDALEALRILKADNMVVGVFSNIDEEAEFWGDLAKLPHIGNWREPDLETVIGLEPDLIITYKTNPQKDWEHKLAAHGIAVLRLDFYRLGKLEKEITVLGALLDKQAEAERFCSWHRQLFDGIQAEVVRTNSQPPVYVENYGDFIASGPGTGGNELCVLAGGRNVAADSSISFPRVTPEWVVDKNPQVIIKAVSHFNGYVLTTPDPLNKRRDIIAHRPAWEYIDAVKNGNVYMVDNSIWVGPRGIVGLAYLAKWFHPGILSDLDPEALHKEFFDRFQGIPYKGVYVSAPMSSEK